MATSSKPIRTFASPPPPMFPVYATPSAQLPNTASSSHISDLQQLVDTFVPLPPRTHIRTTSESATSQSSNPFRTPTHTPHLSDSSTRALFSPISPLEEEDSNQQPQTIPLQVTPPALATTDMSEPRKSVNLRQLDGKPYPGYEDETEAKPKKVKVAQDMFPGEMPPGYDRQDYNGPLATKGGHSADCHKCGGHKKDSSKATPPAAKPAEKNPSAPQVARQSQPQQPQVASNSDCSKCGGSKPRTVPPSSYPAAAMAHVQPKPQATPRSFPSSDSVAGPSSAPHGHRHKCGKCGKQKRPESGSVSAGSTPSQPLSPQNANFGATYQQRSVPALQTNNLTFNINVEPPSAIEPGTSLPFSPVVAERPLIEPIQESEQLPQRKDKKLSRGNSISSLFRSLSRRGSRRPSHESQLPSQKLANGGEQDPSQLIDKISNAIQNGDSPTSPPIQRSASPFSFVSKTQEDQAFEMNDMRKSRDVQRSSRNYSRTPDRRNSWDKAEEGTMFLEERPKFQRSVSSSHKLGSKSVSGVDDLYLGVNPDARPQITRFKSLRVGYNRATSGLSRSASQISRSTSLRRLESVKKVPQFWYREDMVIEGAEGSEYVVNVY